MGRIQAVREAISSDRNKCPIFSQQIKHIKSVIPTSSNRLARLAGGSIPKKPFSANFCPDSAVRTSPKTRLKRFFRLVIKTLKNRKRNRTLPKSMFLKTPKCQNAIMTVLQTMKTSRNVIGKEKNFGKHPPFFPEDLFKNIPKLLSECIVEEEACTTTRNIRRPAQYSKNGQRRFTGCGEALCLHSDACARKPTL